MATKAAGQIHIGIGGWVFEPWRGAFYPDKLSLCTAVRKPSSGAPAFVPARAA